MAFGAQEARAQGKGSAVGYGPLFPTPANNTGEPLLALPEGFQYNVIGRRNTVMTDGRLTPGGHDGMAALPGPGGRVHLVRNHELGGGGATSTAYGDLPYDPKALGGTTTLIVDPDTRLVVEDFASLSGTVRNCAGGPTPWGHLDHLRGDDDRPGRQQHLHPEARLQLRRAAFRPGGSGRAEGDGPVFPRGGRRGPGDRHRVSDRGQQPGRLLPVPAQRAPAI
jgi:hypothetical protein